MKISSRIVVSVVLLGLIAASPSFAKQGDKAVDLTLDVATEPASGFGSAVGVTLGGGYEVIDSLQARIDLSYYSWDQGAFGDDITYRRIPLDIGARYYFQLPPKGLKVYPLAALEISFDELEFAVPFFPKQTEDKVHAGVVTGGGVDYALTKEFSVGANLKAHLITDGYVTMGLGGTFHF